jgi:hypothetical protein
MKTSERRRFMRPEWLAKHIELVAIGVLAVGLVIASIVSWVLG